MQFMIFSCVAHVVFFCMSSSLWLIGKVRQLYNYLFFLSKHASYLDKISPEKGFGGPGGPDKAI